MQAIQDLLTFAIEATTIIGFGGIIAHDIWQQSRRFMQGHCLPVAPFVAAVPVTDEAHEIDQMTHGEEPVPQELISDMVREIIQSLVEETSDPVPEAPIVVDPWEAPITTSSPRYWVRVAKPQLIKPLLTLCPAKEVKPATTPQPTTAPQMDLNALNAEALRKLCSQHGIAWRDVRGKNRHATKAMMVFQLERVAA